MILILQAVTRLVTLVLLALLAVVGMAIAVFSIPGGDAGLPRLAELAQLPLVRDEVGAFLEALEAGSATDVAWIAGFGAALVALLLLAGVLWRRRERLVLLASGPPATSSPEGGEGSAGAGSSPSDRSERSERSSDGGQGAPAGRLAARRRPLAQMAAALAGRVRETETLSLKVRPRRRKPGGRLRITARFDRDADPEAGSERIREEVRPVAEPFALRPRVRVRAVREDRR